MSIELYCPHCNRGLRVDSRYAGRSLECPGCKRTFEVPVPVAKIKPLIDTSTESMTARMAHRRRRATPLAVFLRITLVTLSIGGPLVFGYLLFQRLDEFKQAVEQKPEEKIVRIEPTPRRPDPTRRDQRPPRIKETPPAPRELIQRESPPPLPPDDPFENTPSSVALPGTSFLGRTALLPLPEDVIVTVQSNSPELALKDSVIFWKSENAPPEAVASVENMNGSLFFQWSAKVTEESATALQNSLLLLEHGSESHAIALRQPITPPALKFDLSKAAQPIVCKLDPLPPLMDVRFDVVEIFGVSMAEFTGADQHALRLREEVIAWHSGTERLAMRFRSRKRGKTIVVEISHGYMLPSGDEEILTIARGKKKYNELERLSNSAANAASSISGLRSRLSTLRSELSRISGIRTTSLLNGVQVPDTVKAAQKEFALRETNAAIANTQSLIAEAESLIADRQAIDREFAAIDRIGMLARTIHDKGQVAYRFYFLVGEHEVDLIVSDLPARL